jgi:hypothetical protein
MEFRPTCAIPGCGGLGIYRCGECLHTFCEQHAAMVRDTSPDHGEGSWRVLCVSCRLRLSAEAPWWETSSVDWVAEARHRRDEHDDARAGEEAHDAPAR